MDEKEFAALFAKVGQELYPFWKMQAFRQQRIDLIQDNMSSRYPVELEPGTYLVVHLIPASFSRERKFIDLQKVMDPDLWLHPIGGSEKNTFEDFNFSGLLFSSGTHLKPAYTQLFRDGIIEALTTIAKADKIISLLKLQMSLQESLKIYLNTLERLEVKPPIYLFLKILSSTGVKLSSYDITQYGPSGEKVRTKPMVRNTADFPEFVITDLKVNLDEFLKPIFDIFWNIFGYPCAPEL